MSALAIVRLATTTILLACPATDFVSRSFAGETSGSDAPLIHSASISAEAQSAILKEFTAALPDGWSIMQTQRESAPGDWRTFDRVGFLVEGRKDGDWFSTWFLPRDWIGIRRPDPKRRREVHWEGILVGKEVKSITNGPPAVQETVRKLSMIAALDVNSWKTTPVVFRGRYDNADSTARRLIRQFCSTDEERREAAFSLSISGVPAKSIFLDYAANGAGLTREFCISTLGEFRSKDCVQALIAVLSDASVSENGRYYAINALDRIGDPEGGPILVTVLKRLTSHRDVSYIAKALAHMRYAPAGEELLAHLENETNEWTKMTLANTLAVLRYKKAIPVIEKLCTTKELDSTWAFGDSRSTDSSPELALLRLTGSWGDAADGVRLMLLGPRSPRIGKDLKLALMLENVGDKELSILNYISGTLVINGKENRLGPWGWDGMINFGVDTVWRYPLDLSALINEAGDHSIQYSVGNAKSNVLVLKIPSAVPER